MVLFAAIVALLTLLLRAPAPWRLDVGTPGDTRFLYGFYRAEANDEATFRWTGPEARLVPHGAPTGPLMLSITLHGGWLAESDDPQLRIERSGQALVAFAAQPGWRRYDLLLPPGAALQKRIEAAPLHLVSALRRPGAGDGRDLGAPIDWVQITPIGPQPIAPPLLRALIYGWALAIVGGAAGLALHRLAHWQGQAPVLLGLAVAAAGGLALIVWAWRNPYELAWALPGMPWALGLITLLLLRLGLGPANLALARPLDTSTVSSIPRPWLWLTGITMIALALRLYQIDQLPYGLWRDEARHGLVALQMLSDPSYRPAYVPHVDLPGLGLYPFALAIQLWGLHPWSLRLLTALAGALTVVPLYGLALRLSGRQALALIAAAFLAISSWHVAISRFSFPTIFDPLLRLTSLWLLIEGIDLLRRRRPGPGIAALIVGGVCLGVGLQTYHTGRVAPALAGVLALLLLWHDRRAWRIWLVSVLVFGVGFLAAAAPFLGYALREAAAFNDRVSDVFLLADEALKGRAPLAMLDDSLGRHLLMFNLHGDSNGRHHAPGAPLLDPVTGGCFIIGVGFVVLRRQDWRSLAVLGGLVLGVVPSVLAVEGPHAMRAIGALPFAVVLAANGLLCGIEALATRLRAASSDRHGWIVAAWPGALVIALVLNTYTYFIAMPVDPRVWASVYPIHTQIGAYVRSIADEHGVEQVQHVYVPARIASNDVYVYLTYGLPAQAFDLEQPPEAAPPGSLFLLSGYTYQADVAALEPLLGPAPAIALRGPDLPGRPGEPAFVGYQLP